MSTFFGNLKKKEPDAVFNITTMYKNDNDRDKVNLGVGGKICRCTMHDKLEFSVIFSS